MEKSQAMLRLDGAGGCAGIALVHGDHPVFRGQQFGPVVPGTGSSAGGIFGPPHGHGGEHTARRKQHQRIAAAEFLIMNFRVVETENRPLKPPKC